VEPPRRVNQSICASLCIASEISAKLFSTSRRESLSCGSHREEIVVGTAGRTPVALLHASFRHYLTVMPLRLATLHLHQVGTGLSPRRLSNTAYNKKRRCSERAAATRITKNLLLFLFDGDLDLRGDLAEHLDDHLRLTNDLDRFRKLHLALVHLEALRGESFRDIAGGD
jgi:hypothetical protein